MKIDITVKHADGSDESWVENYDRPSVKTIEDANKFAAQLIQTFNNTLRPHEKARKILSVTLVGESDAPDHNWSKTNLVTIINPRLGFYDTLQCERCGITANIWIGYNSHRSRISSKKVSEV